MILLTPELRAALRANADHAAAGDHDPLPVLKLFNPLGAGTWLATELYDDDDTLFGLADLGFGCPELGYVSLSELASVRGKLGLPIEREFHFTPTMTLSAYADEARAHGAIRA